MPRSTDKRDTAAHLGARVRDKQPRASRVRGWASLRDLEIFRAVIEHGSVTGAARHLNISQPAVSRSISSLEERSGRFLFSREGHKLSPTSDGLALFEETHLIFDAYAKLDDFRWRHGGQETLSISTSPTIATCLLTPHVARFSQEFPDVRINLEAVTMRESIEAVRSGSADIGIIDPPAEDIGLSIRPFRRSQLVVAMRKDHPLASHTRLSPDDLRGLPVITWVKRNPIRAILDRLLWRDGELPNIIIETSNAVSVLQCVEAGLGIAIVNPFPVWLAFSDTIILRALDQKVEYDTSIVTNPNRPQRAAAQRFIDFLVRHQPEPTVFSRPV